MATVTHTKVSAKSDSPDTTLVRPSDWNADHVITGLGAPQGRLTLAASVPVMVNAVTAATTIYYTPYLGNVIPIFDGTNMVMTTFTELSVATTDTVNSPAAIGAQKVNDWFIWNDSGTLRLVHGPDWTNDTTRSAGAVLNYILGIYTNSVAITNGPATNRGTYVGTTKSDASSKLDWILNGSGAGGSSAFLWVWNAYNRVRVVASVLDTTASWAYDSTTWRPANNSTSNSIVYVDGLAETAVDAFYGVGFSSGNSGAQIGVNRDSSSATPSTQSLGFRTATVGSNSSLNIRVLFVPSLGAHTLYAMENAYDTNAALFYGSGWGGGAGQVQYLIASLIM